MRSSSLRRVPLGGRRAVTSAPKDSTRLSKASSRISAPAEAGLRSSAIASATKMSSSVSTVVSPERSIGEMASHRGALEICRADRA